MKARSLFWFCLPVVLFVMGLFLGHYFTAVRDEYLRAYWSANGAFIVLESLERPQTNLVFRFEMGTLLGAFHQIDRLPRWTRAFNPGDRNHPIQDAKMQARWRILLQSGILKTNDLERILQMHFSHYE